MGTLWNVVIRSHLGSINNTRNKNRLQGKVYRLSYALKDRYNILGTYAL